MGMEGHPDRLPELLIEVVFNGIELQNLQAQML
jgi:hypothetical protein